MDSAAFQELVTSLVRDSDSRLSPDDITAAIGLVTNRYSADRPRDLIEDVVVAAGNKLVMPLGWVHRSSNVMSIETPLDNNPPTYVKGEYFYVYRLPDATDEIRFCPGVAAAGAVCRVAFTAPHAGPETFADDDYEAAACLGAAFLCDQLAASYGHDSNPTIASDSVDHHSKGGEFARRAKSLRARYEERFGKPTRTQGASAVAQVDMTMSNGRRRIFH